jgi:hypothetical protein
MAPILDFVLGSRTAVYDSRFKYSATAERVLSNPCLRTFAHSIQRSSKWACRCTAAQGGKIVRDFATKAPYRSPHPVRIRLSSAFRPFGHRKTFGASRYIRCHATRLNPAAPGPPRFVHPTRFLESANPYIRQYPDYSLVPRRAPINGPLLHPPLPSALILSTPVVMNTATGSNPFWSVKSRLTRVDRRRPAASTSLSGTVKLTNRPKDVVRK